jgi:hypothetical protein
VVGRELELNVNLTFVKKFYNEIDFYGTVDTLHTFYYNFIVRFND